MGFDAEKELTTDKVFSTALEGLLSTVFPSALLRAQHSMWSLLKETSMLQSSCGSTRSWSSTCHFLKCKATVKRWAQCDILSWSLWKKLLARGRNFGLIVGIRIVQCSEYIVSLMARICPDFASCDETSWHFLNWTTHFFSKHNLQGWYACSYWNMAHGVQFVFHIPPVLL